MNLNRHHLWVVLIVALLGMSVIIQGTGLWLANTDPSFSVVEDYEGKARDWDLTRIQEAHNEALGWTIEISTSPLQRGVEVELLLADSQGNPLEAAQIDVVAFHIARAANRLSFTLADLGAGRYGQAAPLTRTGLWEFQVDVRAGDERFTARRRLSLVFRN